MGKAKIKTQVDLNKLANSMHRKSLKQHLIFWDDRAYRENKREKENPVKQVHTDLLWRSIKKSLTRKKNLYILDAGGGSGRFSFSLARIGHRIVLLDISSEMLTLASKKARKEKISNLEFVQGSIDDLSLFNDKIFDLTLCLDSPLSYCPHSYKTALSELLRVTKAKIILCVMNRLGIISEGGVNFDLLHFGKLRTVPKVYSTGTLATSKLKKYQPTLLPDWHAFTPVEIKDLIEKRGWTVEAISAPGSLARFVEPELLKKLFKNQKTYKEYLDFEEKYDADPSVLGVGAVGAGGLLVVARQQGL